MLTIKALLAAKIEHIRIRFDKNLSQGFCYAQNRVCNAVYSNKDRELSLSIDIVFIVKIARFEQLILESLRLWSLKQLNIGITALVEKF